MFLKARCVKEMVNSFLYNGSVFFLRHGDLHSSDVFYTEAKDVDLAFHNMTSAAAQSLMLHYITDWSSSLWDERWDKYSSTYETKDKDNNGT